MKLFFSISSLTGGGAERVLVILCNELVNRGHEVYVATNKKRSFAYDLDKRITIVELYPENFSFKKKIHRWYSFYKHNRFLIKKIKPDIIISFTHGLNVHVILSTLDLKIPVVSSEHFNFEKKHNWFEYFSRFYVNRLATSTVILTQHDYNYLGKKIKNKIVIPNPLSYPKNYILKERKNNVLAVGSIDRWEHKGFDNLIKVWGKVSKNNPDWVLEIAGDGSVKSFEYLKSLVIQNNVKNNVIFLGFQKHMDKILQQTSVFILSSRYEGLPMVLLEAMSQGCSCIAFDCKTGPNEIIKHNISGVLVEDQNLEQMEELLNKMLSDKKLRSRLSEGALEEVERFSPNVIVDKWESLFKKIKKSV